jgi:3-methyladenine DNA glycosylase AlkD
MLDNLLEELKAAGNPDKIENYQRFFKTGRGEYAEGDVFLGIKVPVQRQIAKKYLHLGLNSIQKLLDSKIHEHRFVALVILISKYKKAKKDMIEKRRIFEFYLKNTARINNWDLVDVSAANIIGDFIQKESSTILRQLAKSENLWERRIAIVSTMTFIKKRSFGETLAISEMLLKDSHDLIHKAVGWMLREVGKKNQDVLELFLSSRYKDMPRTMLRYTIEKFGEDKKRHYMNKS